jgi:hypothetical protein
MPPTRYVSLREPLLILEGNVHTDIHGGVVGNDGREPIGSQETRVGEDKHSLDVTVVDDQIIWVDPETGGSDDVFDSDHTFFEDGAGFDDVFAF